MPEEQTDLLHELGNHLNAAILLAEDLEEQLHQSHLSGLSKANGLLKKNKDQLQIFFQKKGQGDMLVTYLAELETALISEQKNWKAELNRMTKVLAEMRALLLLKN